MTVLAEKNGNRVWLTGWLGPSTPEMCKAVGAGRFSKEDGAHWSYPLTLGTCRKMREVFGKRMLVGPQLRAWALEEREREREAVALATQHDAQLLTVPELYPTMAQAMAGRVYQRAAAKFIAIAGNVLIADEPGLGKTLETIAGIIERQGADQLHNGAPRRHLVIAPRLAVLSVWVPEIQHWLEGKCHVYGLTGPHDKRAAHLQEALDRSMLAPHGTWIVCNWETARIKDKQAFYPALFDVQWDTIVVDEGHEVLVRSYVKAAKDPSGSQAKRQQTQVREGLMRLKADHKIALTGTPLRGKPEQLWGTLNWLRPREHTSYWRWIETHFETSGTEFTQYNSVIGKQKDPDALAMSLRTTMLRRTKEEVLSQLPPKQYAGTYLIPDDDQSPHGVWLEMSAKQAEQYEQLSTQGVVEFEDGELIANGVLAENTRKAQLASACGALNDKGELVSVLDSVKFDWLVGKIHELDGARVVVVSQFTRLIDMVERELAKLGIGAHVVTGKVTSDRKRAAMIADFQSESPSNSVFLLNTKAGGTAITLDMADHLVTLDELPNPDRQIQVENRVHRTSRMHNVTVYQLRSLGTIEEEIAWVAAAREDVERYLLDGTRGVHYAKQLYLDRKS